MSLIERIRNIFTSNDSVQEPGKPRDGEFMGNPDVRDAHDQQSQDHTAPPAPLDEKVRPATERGKGD